MEIEIMHTTTINDLPQQQRSKVMVSKAPLNTQRIITGFRMKLVEFLIRIEIVFLVIRLFSNPLSWYKIYKSMDPHRREVLGERKVEKIVYVDGKYYWGLFFPGWPSSAFHQFLKAEINRRYPVSIKTNRFMNIFMAITNKCPLACEHCYEWDSLNTKNQLTVKEIKSIVEKFQEKGVTQIHLSGGEPMVRMNDVLDVLETTNKDSEFWILTSGFHLTAEKALKLKEAGLTGVMISLDHFDPAAHSAFRGFKDAFYWVEQAVSNAIAAKLVTSLSICVTRAFVSEPNLMKYMELAKKMGVAFVQILEPRATGHYKNQDVALTKEHEAILDTFYLKMNYNTQFRDFPPICYHGFHQRRMGCIAAGNRSLYVDTIGDLHACPFCQKKTGSALTDDLDNAIGQLQKAGCHLTNINFSH